MSIRTTQNYSIDQKNRDDFLYDSAIDTTIYTTDPWTRPADWLELPTITDSDEKFVGLVGIFSPTNTVRISVSGDYTIDWGDGVIENYSNNTTATHVYNFNTYNANNSTLTSQGYKQAIVVVTPQAGQSLTRINLQQRNDNVQSSTNGQHNTAWLDIAISGASLNSLTVMNNIGNTLNGIPQNPQVFHNRLEQFKLYNNDLTNLTELFAYCENLSSVPIFNTNKVTLANSLFNSTAIRSAPSMNTDSLLYAESMFSGCTRLIEVPNYNTANAISLASMFSSCRTLKKIPLINTANAVSLVSMFSNCSSLETVPLLNTANAVSLSSMFSSCTSLKEVPLFNTANVTTMASMFSSCRRLETVPLFNTANVTDMSSMFSGCFSLPKVPVFNTANVTNMSSMFSSCYRIKKIPSFNTANVTNMSSMFANCNNFEAFPDLNTANVTNMSSMFSSCGFLKSVPLFNTANVTNMSNMFTTCNSLETVPLFNTANVTNMSGMFSSCPSLREVPLFNTANVTDMSSMFAFSGSIRTIPSFDTTKVTSLNGFVRATTSLETFPNLNTANVTNMQFMAASSGIKKMVAINYDKVTDLSYIFNYCKRLQVVEGTANVANNTTFSYAFEGCANLKEFPKWTFKLTGSTVGSFNFTNFVSLTTSMNKFNGIANHISGVLISSELNGTSGRLGNWTPESYAHFYREILLSGSPTSNLSLTMSISSGTNVYGRGAATYITRSANVIAGCTTVSISDTSSLSNGDYILTSKMISGYQSGNYFDGGALQRFSPQTPFIVSMNCDSDVIKIVQPQHITLQPNTLVKFSNTTISMLRTNMPRDPVSGFNMIWSQIAYGSNTFVAVGSTALSGSTARGNSSHYLYSSNGVTWNVGTLPYSTKWVGLAYGNGKFIAINGDASLPLSNTYIVDSTDGINWNSQEYPMANNFIVGGLGYGNGVFIAVSGGSNTRTLVSTDSGSTWSVRNNLPRSQPLVSIAYGNGTWMAAGGNTYYTSTDDGVTWIERTSPHGVFGESQKVKFTNNKFILTGQNSRSNYYESSNAVTWTTISNAGSGSEWSFSPIIESNTSNGTTFLLNDIRPRFRISDVGGNTWFFETSFSENVVGITSGDFYRQNWSDTAYINEANNSPEAWVVIPGNRWLPSTTNWSDAGSNVGAYVVAESKRTSPDFYNRFYFIKNVDVVNNTFQISNTPGGSIVDIPTSNTVNCGMFVETYVTNINPNTSIQVSAPFQTNGNISITFTGKAPIQMTRFKNWAS